MLRIGKIIYPNYLWESCLYGSSGVTSMVCSTICFLTLIYTFPSALFLAHPPLSLLSFFWSLKCSSCGEPVTEQAPHFRFFIPSLVRCFLALPWGLLTEDLLIRVCFLGSAMASAYQSRLRSFFSILVFVSSLRW